MTQQQLADEIGVTKVTVARWESGARNCRGDYVKRVRAVALRAAAEPGRTTTLFDIGRRELSALESTPAVLAFRDLLWCECRRLQVPTSEVHIGTREVADGGIDAFVPALPQFETMGSFLSGGATHFQIKTGLTWKPWQESAVRKELLGKRNQLGSAVERCLSTDGRYVLVSFGIDLTPDQRQEAQSNIEKVFASSGYAEARVDVWGQQELLGLFGRFPFLALRLSGRDDLQFQSWSSWKLSNEMSTVLELGEAQERFRDEIQRLLRDGDTSHIRIIGEPGLGKTRLVHEALGAEDLAPQVVYVHHAEDFQKSGLFHDLLHPDADYFLILVLDECRPRECAEVWDRLGKHPGRCQVISIDHESFQPGDQSFNELECPRLDEEQLVKIIDGYTGGVSGGRRWAEFCSGVPRVAHAIGRNIQTNPEDLLRTPSMRQVWDRLISGYRAAESAEGRQKLTVLRYLSLFHRFGFEAPVQEEGRLIAQLIREDHPEILYARFQEIVAELKEQRILQGKTTLFIAPKLLHVHLWAQFWELYGRDRPIGKLLQSLPDSLTAWFVGMFSYAAESRVALDHVELVLAPGGPFDDPGFALSGLGCRFLHELANASPEQVVSCLERVVGEMTRDELFAFDRGRQDIVWALERAAVWPPLFCRAARLLRRLAESENASNNNNSTGTFTDLFSLAPGQVAPTGAPPEMRFPVLIETLEATSAETRRLGIRACRTAMDIRGTSRIVGREHQGLKTAELWTPKTWGEVLSPKARAMDILFDTSRDWETPLRSEANEALVEGALGLLRVSWLSDRALKTLEALAGDDATDLQQLVQGIAGIFRLSKSEYDGQVLERLDAIDATVTGSSFFGRLRRVVHLSGMDDRFDESHSEEKFNERVRALAAEATRSKEKFREVLGGLVQGTNDAVFRFGRELALRDGGRLLEETVEKYRAEIGSASALFLSGYLAAVFDSDVKRWELIVEDLLGDKSFGSLIGPVIRNSGGSDRIIGKLLAEYDSGSLGIDCLRSFGYSRFLKQLGEPIFLAFVERLVRAGEIAFALELLDFVYCDDRNPRNLPESETMNILREFEPAESRRERGDYHWSAVAKAFVEQFPARQLDLFEVALEKVARRGWSLDGHNPAFRIIQSIIRSRSGESWQILASRIAGESSVQQLHLMDWIGPEGFFGDPGETSGLLTLFPMGAVFEWVAEDPDVRAHGLARAMPKSLARDETGAWARELLTRYGDQEGVRVGLLQHFRSSGWRGEASNHYRRERDRARAWLSEETSMRVRQWLEEFIDGFSRDIEQAEISEEREV